MVKYLLFSASLRFHCFQTQGRKKAKPFIDKKKATTYKLVHRSQKDPLANDASVPQMVLQHSEVRTGVSVSALYIHAHMCKTKAVLQWEHSTL